MIGMIAGNGHPYSWSAIVNGFDPEVMPRCPYPVIREYLGARDPDTVRISGAAVTHVWTDDPSEAPTVAAFAGIPNIVRRPEDVIGEVDAVVIATDDGFDHVRRTRAFIEAGLPVFVDKPLALSVEDLAIFTKWHRDGAAVLSSSGLRYAPELDTCLAALPSLGELRWISGVTCCTWERYGIHILEPISRLLGAGFTSVRLETQPGLEIAHLEHRSGVQASIPVIADGGATFATLHVCGTAGQTNFRLVDTYTAFRRQMSALIEFVRTRQAPHPFSETIELMAVLIAGRRSRAEGCRRVTIQEVLSLLPL
jgi:predicted dehydrogenase